MQKTEKSAWKPPIPLLALDFLGVALLCLGLLMQFAPESAVSQTLPPTLRVPLLIVGGALFVIGWVGLILSLLNHRRG
jgi:hypothetical protein